MTASNNELSAPRFSVIIPTYQRRDVVMASVRALGHQEFRGSFDVIVVVDGSNDGSTEALRSVATPFALKILEQQNKGRASACNRGASVARGEILLFLDDDMEADPRLLTEHDRCHREGADVVLGHIPLHRNSPPGVLSRGVKGWAEDRLRRLSSPVARLTLQDLVTGQMSLSRKVFDRVGRFDTSFTRGGSFGNEDLDLGTRLLSEGYRVVFNPKAISYQYYMVKPRQYLRQWRQAGSADVFFVRKYPEQGSEIFHRASRPLSRYLWRPLVSLRLLAVPLAGALRRLTSRLLESGVDGTIASKLLFETRNLEYWLGVREAGDIPRSRFLKILAYHAIADLSDDQILGPYCVRPRQFKDQMDILLRAGYHFVNAEEFLRFLDGRGGLPRNALLLTFDDCYEDLLNFVLPILEERAIPAVAFAVSGRLGGSNDWDKPKGAAQLRLLDVDGVRELAKRGVEIGAHSRTHRPLTVLSGDELMAEVSGSVADLEKHGLRRPRLFAYPHGESNEKVRELIRKGGLLAGFSTDAGLMQPGLDPFQIPRIEIMRNDVGLKFRKKVALAGRRGFWVEKFWWLLWKRL